MVQLSILRLNFASDNGPDQPSEKIVQTRKRGAVRHRLSTLLEVLDRRQVIIYVAAIGAGIVLGLVSPGAGGSLGWAINPALGALLYVTFLQIPTRDLARSLRDRRFLVAVAVLNFAIVPLVVAAMFVFLPDEQAIRFGVLLVLLSPCIDYVIVFSGLAGGSAHRLLAATPLLLLAQMLLLPVYLAVFLGSDLAQIIAVRPLVEAFVILIVVPLLLAWATQTLAVRFPIARRVSSCATAAMVPLMVIVLFVVVASQIPKVSGSLGDVVAVVPFYVLFLVVMAVVGRWVASRFAFDNPGRRALVFSGATRNSLVVLPLALALPAGYELAAAVVVTQTLVEVVGMVVYVRVIPYLLPSR
ncbi:MULTISPECIES: bile acid:sodium symporter [Actinomycetes]|uniref:arsenic resistance protein n=1 Tax=Actinomycetes TaxID=1760 RepID=UPI0009DF45F1|nr:MULTISPECIES: bile acid:sodium symporter [Actinomycetes]